MGVLQRWLGVEAQATDTTPRVPRFAEPRTVSPNLATVTSWPAFGTSRSAAMALPAVAACRNLIVGAAVQMAIHRYRGGERVDPGRLLRQPDPDTTWAYTLGWTLDDLIFHGRAYWLVLARDGIKTERNPDGLPVRGRWIPYTDVSPRLTSAMGSYSRLEGYDVAGVSRPVPPEGVIRFDSPLPGVLESGSSAIAHALELEAAALRFATMELPAGTLENEGTELSEEDAEALVARFQTARQTRTVAFLQGIKYTPQQISSEELQLLEARAHAATEIARLFAMPVSMISASPSGGASALLYSNLTTQLAVMVSGAVAPHLQTIEDTLSLPSVTPEGQSVAFDVAAFLRSDPAELADYALALHKEDVIDRDETRGLLGIPAGVAPADLRPGTV